MLNIPFETGTTTTSGAPADTPIALPIHSSDALVAVVAYNVAAGEIIGLDPRSFTVTDGAIASGHNTKGLKLTILWAVGARKPAAVR